MTKRINCNSVNYFNVIWTVVKMLSVKLYDYVSQIVNCHCQFVSDLKLFIIAIVTGLWQNAYLTCVPVSALYCFIVDAMWCSTY